MSNIAKYYLFDMIVKFLLRILLFFCSLLPEFMFKKMLDGKDNFLIKSPYWF